MQTQTMQATTSQTHFTTITAESNFDFSTVADGTPLRVSPKLINDLSVGGNNRRKKNRKDSFRESIRTKGVLQSLNVRPDVNDPTRLEVCSGFGRRDMALELNLFDVPVILNHSTDKDALAIMLAENKERQDISIVDEADLAQKYLSLHDGEYKSACIHLGLSEKVFRERLQLKRCTNNVLDKLSDESNKFTLGHALILSTFDAKTQEKTLTAILEQPNVYTVKELKLRSSKRQLPLSKAPFNTTACNTCKHNTGEQLDLLGDISNGEVAKCSMVSCFNEKAQAWVRDVHKKTLEEKYGRVILWEAKPVEDRRTVSPDNVGDKQYNDGCMACENKCAVVDDRPLRWGMHKIDQCISTDCFNELSNKHKKSLEKAELKAQREADKVKSSSTDAVSNVAQQQEEVEVAENAESSAPTVHKTPAAVLEDYRTILRAKSAEATLKEPIFRMALALSSLCEVSGYRVPIDELKQNARTNSLNERTIAYMALEMKAIQLHMGKAVVHHATVSEAHGYSNTTDLMIDVLKNREDTLPLAIEAWTPTKERMTLYKITQIANICQKSGFVESYEKVNKKGSFSKLMKNRKSDIVDAIMAHDFDWSAYAPSDYLDLTC